MTAITAPARRVPALPRSRRLIGVDAARGLALLGMMAAHLVSSSNPDGTPSAAFALVDGRSSATFALLAGVGLALADGGHRGPRTPFGRMVVRTAVRAAVILLVGLVLTTLGPPIAVILQYYALAFLLLAPLLRVPPLLLGLGGLAWLSVVPLLSHLLRDSLGLVGPGPQVGIAEFLTAPGYTLTTLLITGYYPVLTWFGYLLVGAAVGRLALTRRAVALLIAATGAILLVAASLVSRVLLATSGAQQALAAGDPITGRGPEGPFYGTTPTGSWWWLVVDTPHSGTPPDLLGTTGAALLVLGVCLLVAPTVAGWLLVPLAAAGSMTLSLYSGHVIAVLLGLPGASGGVDWAVHAMVAVALATVWRTRFTRGPLEAGTAALVDAVAGTSRPEPRRPASDTADLP